MSVYFFRSGDDGPIKIGFAVSVVARWLKLRAGCPDGLNLIACFQGGRWQESQLHRMFVSERYRGEWFNSCDRLVDFVQSAIAAQSIRAVLSADDKLRFGEQYEGSLEGTHITSLYGAAGKLDYLLEELIAERAA